MKQVILKKGRAVVEDIPAPVISENEVLVQVHYSCISTGTEITGLKRTGNTLAQSALRSPERILKALDMIRKKGFKSAVARVSSLKEKEDAGTRTGYSASGVVLEVGNNIADLQPGDRVACAGAGIADHAEFIAVPRNLMVPVPGDLLLAPASTVTLGAIALQGVRRTDPKLGDNVAVIGLGILGQITAQLLKLSGCRVVGVDLDSSRVELATSLGLDRGLTSSEDMVDEIIRFSGGEGVDSVIITASTPSSEVVNRAMKLCRRKGKVVIVGAVGMDIERKEFYARELDLLISTSYGPGRYDDEYELKGRDYPYAYVRWTENRNLAEYLRLLSEGKLEIEPLIGKVYSIDEAPQAYQSLSVESNKPLIVLLEYHREPTMERKIILSEPRPVRGRINVAVIGAGSFVRKTHLPNLADLSRYYTIYAIADKDGTNARALASRYDASYATTDYREILKDKAIDLVIIGTRHHLHAGIAGAALRAGKTVLLEKPMALNRDELKELSRVIEETGIPFMMGFNRRFSPAIQKIKEVLSGRQESIMINYQMNAGYLPTDHWVHGSEGGGRNIGEACHIYDLFIHLTGSEPVSISASSINPRSGQYLRNDNFIATITFRDGSIGNLLYTSLGHPDLSKERMDIYYEGKAIRMDDYREIIFYGIEVQLPSVSQQEKGHHQELESLGLRFTHGDALPIPIREMVEATEISFAVEECLQT